MQIHLLWNNFQVTYKFISQQIEKTIHLGFTLWETGFDISRTHTLYQIQILKSGFGGRELHTIFFESCGPKFVI